MITVTAHDEGMSILLTNTAGTQSLVCSWSEANTLQSYVRQVCVASGITVRS